MDTVTATLKFIDRIMLNALKTVAIVVFILLTVLITANVFVRFFPVASLHWFDEIIELLYAYMVFYGAAALWITREHIHVGDWLGGALAKNERLGHAYGVVVETLVLAFACVFFYYSWQLTERALDVTNVFQIPKKILYSCMPVSGAVMVVYSIRNIIVELIGAVKPGHAE
jgi:TRAP-type C4-dicarboxylate transport system permease small subunit